MEKKNIKRIGIRIPNWIGDAVLSTPFVRFTVKHFPDAEIYLLFRKNVKDVFLNHDYSAHHIIINDKQDDIIKTGLLLREYKFDLYLNLPESLSSILIAFISGARIKAGYKGETYGLFLNHKLKPSKNMIHRALKYFRILSSFLSKYEKLDKNMLEKDFIENARTEVPLNEEEIERGKQILSQYNLKGKIIGINPNSSAESRKWLKARYARLADILLESNKVKIIFFGNTLEKEYVESVIGMMDNQPVNLAGKINLREYIALLKLINLFITNDSGPMHLANAVSTDVIALEGPADINETGMLNQDSKRIYMNKRLSCSPCVKNICPKNNECMKAILVKDVLKEIDQVLPIS